MTNPNSDQKANGIIPTIDDRMWAECKGVDYDEIEPRNCDVVSNSGRVAVDQAIETVPEQPEATVDIHEYWANMIA